MATRPFRYVSVDKQALAEGEAAAYRWSVTSIGELRGAACTETSDREAASQGGSFASCAQNFHLVSSTMLNLHWRRRPPGDDWAFRGTYQRVPHTAIMDPPTAERTLSGCFGSRVRAREVLFFAKKKYFFLPKKSPFFYKKSTFFL